MKSQKIMSSLFFFCRFWIYLFLFALNKLLEHFGGQKSNCLVLCYHSIAKDKWRFSLDPETFQKQIDYLTRYLCPLKADDLSLYFEGKKEIRQPSFILSFDDGYRDIYEVKDYLKQKGIRPIIFLLSCSKRADRSQLETERDFLTWQQVKELIRDGWAVGCHSDTHADFFTLSAEKIEREIRQSKKRLEHTLGIKVNCFAYPKGRYNRQILAAVKKEYDFAFSMEGGFVSLKDRYRIPRMGIDRSHRFLEFQALLSPAVVSFKSIIGRSFLRYLFL